MKARVATIPVLALLLTLMAAAPAAAQSSGQQQYEGDRPESFCTQDVIVDVNGTLEKAQTPYPNSSGYAITGENSGCIFALSPGNLDLQQYVGERVKVTGNTTAKGGGSEPRGDYHGLLHVHEVTPLEHGRDGKATLTFKVDTKGEVPENTTFFGFQAPADSGIVPNAVQLKDSDGDGTYTRSIELEKGSYEGVEIEQGFGTVTGASAILPGEPRQTLRGPETIALQSDKAFSATADFRGQGDGNTGNAGNNTSDDQYGETGNGGDQYGSDSPSGPPASEEAGSGSGNGDTGEDSDGNIPVLPDTGGAALFTLGAGALLVAGGLLARRLVR